MSVELNPCRCGGKALLVTVYGTCQRYARCCQCCASGPWSTDPEKAAALWAEFCPVARPAVKEQAEEHFAPPRPGFRQCVFHKGHAGECVYNALPASYVQEHPEKRCSATERQHSPGKIGPDPSPLATAVETARSSARCANLDLQLALKAAGGSKGDPILAWLLLYDLLEPLAKVGNRLETIAQRLGEGKEEA